MTESIELGWLVRDTVSGLEGITVAKIKYLNGCSRLAVQPQELKSGKPVMDSYVDEPQLVILSKTPDIQYENKPAGGPREDSSERTRR